MKNYQFYIRNKIIFAVSLILSLALLGGVAMATTLSQSGSVGVQGEIPSLPPTQAATIAIPVNGNIFSNLPITVSGTCPSNLLIKIFSNGVFIGSVICSSGSYSLQVSLFQGQNVLSAIDYDSLNQAGPTSNTVNVTYSNGQFAQAGTQLTLTSIYGELGTTPGSQLTWPIIINGGTPPYAVSVDWGDSTSQELLSEANPGTFNITHTYQVSGVYKVVIKATDNKGQIALLQLVGQGTGAIIQTSSSSKNNIQPTSTTTSTTNIWINLLAIPLIVLSFWIGKKYHEKDLKQKAKQYEQASKIT